MRVQSSESLTGAGGRAPKEVGTHFKLGSPTHSGLPRTVYILAMAAMAFYKGRVE